LLVAHTGERSELLVCAWRGHAIPGATADALDDALAPIGRPTVDGRRIVQCLRCGGWFVVDEPTPGSTAKVGAIVDLDRPRRGKALREALVVRVIAIDRAIHTIAFASVAVAALAVRGDLRAVRGWANSMLAALASARHGNGGASTHGLTAALLTRLSHLTPHSLLWLAVIAGVYAVVSGFEAVGLWYEQRWAEYLTVLATAGFLPLEIKALVDRVTFVRVLAMVVNLAILVYLVVAKHLFGVGGPRHAESPTELAPLPTLLPPAERGKGAEA
jgi:uncharacterized membrane protein (DUF2068 family)